VLDKLAGEIEGLKAWGRVQLKNGHAALDKVGSMVGAIEADLNGIPLSLSLETGPQASEAYDRMARPLQVKAAAAGTEMTGKGAIVVTGAGHSLKLATQIRGDRLDTLGDMLGASLPDIGPYDVRADFVSGDGVLRLRDFQAQLGPNRLSGAFQWHDQDPRPLLSGRLSSSRLQLKAFASPSAPPAGKTAAHIDLAWLKAFDSRLEIAIDSLADTPIPVKQIDTSVTIAEGRLSAPFRARISGTPWKGQVDLSQPDKTPQIALRASADKIDAAQFLRPIGSSKEFRGTVTGVQLDSHSRGRTLAALLKQAALNVKLHTADLKYKGQFAGRSIDLGITAAEIATDKAGPLHASFTGTFQRLPFDAQASTAPLNELLTRETPLPIRLDMQTAYANFSGRGTVARPLTRGDFDLEHEITGDEIEGLDPLIDLAFPLQGAFSARGTITGRGGHVTYVEDLQLGKSDFQLTVDFWQRSPRPLVKAKITSKTIYLNNIKLLPGNDPPRQAPERRYLIPEYMLPVDYLQKIDLDIDIKARRVLSGIGDLGSLTSQASLKDGHFVSTATIAKPGEGQAHKRVEVDATVDPPMNKLVIDAHGIDYTFLREFNPETILEEGTLDLRLRLSGPGTTRRKILNHADGAATLIGGPGRLRERRIELWATDLIPTLLSPRWRSEEAAELNCMVAHIKVADGAATIDDMLLDTSRVTIAGSGVVNLENEELDIFLAPRPKQASLVSLANPVNIKGTLSEPEIAVARLPGRSSRRLARTGILAGLINPLFLLTALSDFGTLGDNPCTAAVERAREAASEDQP
jgi:hypothetical protein